MTNVPKGANATLPRAVGHFELNAPGTDVLALLLTGGGGPRGHQNLVHASQPRSYDNAVEVMGGCLRVELSRVSPEIERIVLVSSSTSGPLVSALGRGVAVQLDHTPAFELEMGGLSIETVVVLGELYRRGEEWKVRSISQGYPAVDGLLHDHGFDATARPVP